MAYIHALRITSYNVCYTKLLRTLEDLKKYEAVERKPVKGTYKDFEIISMPPPSSGGIAIIEMLNMMENANLDSIKFNSSQYVHLIAEVMRRAYADRSYNFV